MLIEWLLELKDNIDRHGIRWGILFALYAVYRKERRNYLLDKRDEAIFHNQRIIMERLECSDQWRGQVKASNYEDLLNLRRSFSSSPKANQWANQLRRVKTMENIKWATLVPGVISAAKLVLQSFGIDIPDEHINAIVNGAAAVGAIVAIFMSHRKQEVSQNGSTIPGGFNK